PALRRGARRSGERDLPAAGGALAREGGCGGGGGAGLSGVMRMRARPTADLPDDPRLPGLMAIRDSGLARAIPALGLEQGGGGVELVLCGYHPGARATLEARVGQRRFAVKTFADDPAPEAALYQALGAAGLAGDSGARVPPLLAWDRDLRVLVIGWLEGPTAHDLVKEGQGRHAGELGAQWVRRTASLPVKLGLPFGTAGMMHETRAWIGTLGTADLSVGAAARALAEALARSEPRDDGVVGLVHGTLYARHILDAGEGPGVIDWHRFGQGPAELDAGMFLATLSRLRLLHPVHAGEALLAEQAFLEGTRGLLDEGALAWHLRGGRDRHRARDRLPGGAPRARDRAARSPGADRARAAPRRRCGRSGGVDSPARSRLEPRPRHGQTGRAAQLQHGRLGAAS